MHQRLGVLLLALFSCTPGQSLPRLYIGPPGTVETHAVIQVNRGTTIQDVVQLRVTVRLNGEVKEQLLPATASVDALVFPQTFALVARGQEGSLKVDVEALERDGTSVASHAAGGVDLRALEAVNLALDLWRCGDRVPDRDELCDDGNTNPADACDACRTVAWKSSVVVSGSTQGRGALEANMTPEAVAVDALGRVIISDTGNGAVLRLGTDGQVTNLLDLRANGIAAVVALAVDELGRIFMAESGQPRVLVLEPDGSLTVVAGTGMTGFSGDGGAATLAQLFNPRSIALDGAGGFYVADQFNWRVRHVGPDGTITTVAGNGLCCARPRIRTLATEAAIQPVAVAVTASGSLLIGDNGNNVVWAVLPDGNITAVAGNGVMGSTGDGGLAVRASINVSDLVVHPQDGTIFIVEQSSHRVRAVWPDGSIGTVAGGGAARFGGDGSLATDASLNLPTGAAVGPRGDLYVADYRNGRVRQVDVSGVIHTVAGGALSALFASGRSAVSAPVSNPHTTFDLQGRLIMADMGLAVVRRLEADGTLTTLAGNGVHGFSGDDGPAVQAQLNSPRAVVVDASGRIFIADSGNHRIRVVGLDGTIHTFAGTGEAGLSGDGGPALQARMDSPIGLVFGLAGELLVSDYGNNRVRVVTPDLRMEHVAGAGSPGALGDDGPARLASLDGPQGLAMDSTGRLYIAEAGGNRIRRVAADGTITTFAGTGTPGFSGDGGPAMAARLQSPMCIAFDGAGRAFIGDYANGRVRVVDAQGIISTFLGDGQWFPAEPTPRAQAATSGRSLAVDGQGRLVVGADEAVVRHEPDGTVAAIAGTLTPPFEGPLERAALLLPRSLLRTGGFTLAAGRWGRILRVDDTSVTAVVGFPGYKPPNPNHLAALVAPLSSPLALALDSKRLILYVSEQPGPRLPWLPDLPPLVSVRLDTNGDGQVDAPSLWTMAELPAAAQAALAGIRGPAGITFDNHTDTLLVADAADHCVRRVDLEAGVIQTVAGTCGVAGVFPGFLNAPSHVAVGPSGAVYVSDTGNHRVLRVAVDGEPWQVVLGDGSQSSAGQGVPATAFPVDSPGQLALDTRGNLYVTSRTAVRVVATPEGAQDANGTGYVRSIYQGDPQGVFPLDSSLCLAGLALEDDDHVLVADSCGGFMLRISRSAAPVAVPPG